MYEIALSIQYYSITQQANAIFVDEMVMDNNDELEAKLDALIKLHQEQSEKFELIQEELRKIKSRIQ